MRSAWSGCWPRSPRAWPGMPGAPPLLAGTGRDDTHLLVVATSDRGLAGGFNASILREARRRIRELDSGRQDGHDPDRSGARAATGCAATTGG